MTGRLRGMWVSTVREFNCSRPLVFLIIEECTILSHTQHLMMNYSDMFRLL